MPGFHTGAKDLNSKYHVCAASTLQSDFHDPPIAPVYFNIYGLLHHSLKLVEMGIMFMTKGMDHRKKKGTREEKEEMGKGDRRRRTKNRQSGRRGRKEEEEGKAEEEQQR